MQHTDTTIPTGFRQNAMGHLVPEERIAPIDKLRDDLVLGIITKAKAHREALAAFKLGAMAEIADFVDLSAEEYGVEYGGAKGNVTLTSFDGRYKLVRAVGEHRVFDERIQAAKALIDQCIARWSDGARSELKALIEHAFRVNKQGRIDVNQVLSLRQLDIADPEWKEAMDAIADAIQVNGTSTYVRMYERQGDGRYLQIALDPAKL
jgi:hypothetical protein